jgi:hypothetical protein
MAAFDPKPTFENLSETDVIGFCEKSGMAKYKWPE